MNLQLVNVIVLQNFAMVEVGRAYVTIEALMLAAVIL